MATIRKTIDIKASPEAVWDKIADVSSISNHIGFLSDSKVSNDKRVCTLNDGGVLEEDIISIDANLKRMVYSITKSPLNMSFHVASMEVEPNGNGARLIWTIDLMPGSAAEHIDPMLDAACKDMETALAG